MIKRYFPPVRETVLLVVITLAFPVADGYLYRASYGAFSNDGLVPGSVFCRKDNP